MNDKDKKTSPDKSSEEVKPDNERQTAPPDDEQEVQDTAEPEAPRADTPAGEEVVTRDNEQEDDGGRGRRRWIFVGGCILLLIIALVILYALRDRDDGKSGKGFTGHIPAGTTEEVTEVEEGSAQTPVTMDQVRAEVSQQIGNIGTMIDQKLSPINGRLNTLTSEVENIKSRKAAADADDAIPPLPVGKVLTLASLEKCTPAKAFVTEERDGDHRYWSASFYGIEVKGSKVLDPKIHEEFAEKLSTEGFIEANIWFREQILGNNNHQARLKYMVCNMDAERKERFIKNIDTVLFKVSAKAHWAWDPELKAYVTSNPDGIIAVLITDFNIQTKAKQQRTNERCKNLKAEFER